MHLKSKVCTVAVCNSFVKEHFLLLFIVVVVVCLFSSFLTGCEKKKWQLATSKIISNILLTYFWCV